MPSRRSAVESGLPTDLDQGLWAGRAARLLQRLSGSRDLVMLVMFVMLVMLVMLVSACSARQSS